MVRAIPLFVLGLWVVIAFLWGLFMFLFCYIPYIGSILVTLAVMVLAAVEYANAPDHKERAAHGFPAPFNIKLWQLGNETSYGSACFKRDEAIRATIEFAKAMRERDRSIQLIGWGDNGWAGELLERAGEHAHPQRATGLQDLFQPFF